MYLPSLLQLQKHKIVGVGLKFSDRTGLETILNNYSIITTKPANWISQYPNLDKVHHLVNTSNAKTETIFLNPQITKMLHKLAITAVILYKPTPLKLNIPILQNNYKIYKKFENKSKVRQTIPNLKFPPFEFIYLPNLIQSPLQKFKTLNSKYGKFVIQHSMLSGGRGTYIINSYQEFQNSLNNLSTQTQNNPLIISKFIQGSSISIQACNTSNYGTLTSGIQKQIISQPELCNTTKLGSSQFCGGQWSPNDFTKQDIQFLQNQAQVAGKIMFQYGYLGIFGIDAIKTSDNQIYIIEINARLTDMTPILTAIQINKNTIPLQYLHILEHLQIPYKLTTNQLDKINSINFDPPTLSYLIFYNSYAQPIKPNIIKSGIYSIQDPSAPPSKTSNHPNPLFPKLTPYQYFLYETPNPNALIKPGKRYLKMLIPTKSLNEHNQLQPEISQLITKIHNII